MKRFTPPPPGADYHAPSSSEEEYSEEEYSDEYSEEEEEVENVKRYSTDDEALKQVNYLFVANMIHSHMNEKINVVILFFKRLKLWLGQRI